MLGHEFAGETESGEGSRLTRRFPAAFASTAQRGEDPPCCLTVVSFAGHSGQDGAMREYLCSGRKSRLRLLPDSLSGLGWRVMLEPLGSQFTLWAWLTCVRDERRRFWLRSDRPLDNPTGAAERSLPGYCVGDPPAPRGCRKSLRRKDRFSNLTLRAEKAILEATGGRGLDVVFEVGGTEGQWMTPSAAMPGGKVILAGIPEEECTALFCIHSPGARD